MSNMATTGIPRQLNELDIREQIMDAISEHMDGMDIRMGTYAEEGVLTFDEGIILGINNQRFHITIKEN